MKLSKKACAYIVRRSDAGALQLLVLSFASKPHLPLRLPGGTLLDEEASLVGMFRELSEETGLNRLTVIRKLGIQRYYKEYTQANVERHDYLLHAAEDVPVSFSHTVGGTGGDAGAVFDYRWIGQDEFGSIDSEFQQQLTPDYLPELFVEAIHAASRTGRPAVGSAAPVTVVDYDAAWPRMFREQCAVLEEVLSDALIEHVGSTAVPGLGAKPVIDILAGVSRLSEVEARAPQLTWLGYEYVPDYEDRLPDRRYFRKISYIDRAHTYHLHCVVRGSPLWGRYLTFRDYLRARPEAALAYFALKQSLTARHGADRVAYTEGKTSFIESILRSAGLVPP